MQNWSATWAITRKDLSVWIRQPTTIAATILPALVLVLVIYISSAAVGRNRVDLIVQDTGPHARRLVSILNSSDAFIVHAVTTPEQARRDLSGLVVEAIITVPADFDTAYNAHQADPVTIEINNLNLDYTNDLRRSLPAAITTFYGQQGDSPMHVTVAETDTRAQDISLPQFELVPDLVLLLTVAGVINSGLATAREWEDLTIKEVMLAPIARSTFIVGKLLAGWLTGMLVGSVVLLIGALIGALRPQGIYWLTTLLAMALTALASAGLGVMLGAIARRFQLVTAIGVTASFYLFFLSGGVSVAAFLPAWVQAIAQFIPTFYGVHALQMSIFYSSTDQLARDILVLLATAIVTVTLGALTLRRSVLAN